jgi:hypothetical protein
MRRAPRGFGRMRRGNPGPPPGAVPHRGPGARFRSLRPGGVGDGPTGDADAVRASMRAFGQMDGASRPGGGGGSRRRQIRGSAHVTIFLFSASYFPQEKSRSAIACRFARATLFRPCAMKHTRLLQRPSAGADQGAWGGKAAARGVGKGRKGVAEGLGAYRRGTGPGRGAGVPGGSRTAREGGAASGGGERAEVGGASCRGRSTRWPGTGGKAPGRREGFAVTRVIPAPRQARPWRRCRRPSAWRRAASWLRIQA